MGRVSKGRKRKAEENSKIVVDHDQVQEGSSGGTGEENDDTGGSSNTKKKRPDQDVLDRFYALPDTQQSQRCSAVFDIAFKASKKEAKGSDTFSYLISRLIHGMVSSRLATRLGYANALTQVLSINSAFNFGELLSEIDRELPLKGNKDESIGARTVAHCLCLMCLWKSGKCSTEEKKAVAQKLVEIRETNKSICSFLTKCILDCAENLDEENFKGIFLGLLQKECTNVSLNGATSDQLWLTLALSKKFPNLISPLDIREELSDSSMESLIKIIKSSCQGSVIHPVWTPIVQLVSDTYSEEQFGRFWREVVETNFLGNGKKELVISGIRLTEAALPVVTSKEQIDVLLNDLFLRKVLEMTMDRQMSQFARPICRSLVGKLLEFLRDGCIEDGILIEVLCRVNAVSPRFDQLSRIGLAESLLAQLSPEGASQYLTEEKKRLANTGPTAVVTLIRHMQQVFLNRKQGKVCREEILTSLAVWQSPDSSNSAFPHKENEDVAKACESAFHTCLQSLCVVALKPGNKKIELPQAHAEMMVEIASKLSDTLPERAESKTVVKKGLKLAKKLLGSCEDVAEKGFLVLISYSLLWALVWNRQKYCDILQELLSCFRHYKSGTERKEDGEEPSWMDVIIDLILSLCSLASYKNVKPVVHVAVSCFASEMSFENCQPILQALKINNEALMKEGENDEESDMDTSDGDEENLSLFDSDENSKEASDQENINPVLVHSVKEALGNAAVASDQESVDSDFSDDTMLRLDEGLAAAFRSHTENTSAGRKKRKDEQEQRNAFRMRCFDLLLLFLHSDGALSTKIKLIEPLLELANEAVRMKGYEPVFERARTLILLLCNSKNIGGGVDDATVVDRLTATFGISEKILNPTLQNLAGECIRFLVRIGKSGKTSEECTGAVTGKFMANLQTFMQDRSCTIPGACFGEEHLDCLPVLICYAFDDSVRVFRKTEACTWCLHFCAKNLMPVGDERKKPWKKFMRNFRKGVTRVFTAAIEATKMESNESVLEGDAVKPRYLASLILMLKAVVSFKDHLKITRFASSESLVECLKKMSTNSLWRKKPFVQAARLILASKTTKKSPHAMMKGILRDLGTGNKEENQ